MSQSTPQIDKIQKVSESSTNKQDHINEKEDKTQRKRKILMKQKCNFIDHQINLNLSKLDQLMSMIQSKKYQDEQSRLRTIKQIQEGNQTNDQQTQFLSQNLNENQKNQSTKEQKRIKLKKQRRLKFKYSILRQYQFEENKEQHFQIKHQLRQENIQKNEKNTLSDGQDLLLEGYAEENRQQKMARNQQDQNKKQAQILTAFDSKASFTTMIVKKQPQFYSIQHPQSITVQTRYDWINTYLNKENFNDDTIVNAVTQSQFLQEQKFQVLRFDKKMDVFQCRFTKSNQNFTTQEILNDQSKISIPYNQFINQYPQVNIIFHKHTQAVDIIHPQISQVVKLDLTKTQRQIRVLVKAKNQSQKYMQRIIIFKQLPSSTKQDEEKYKIAWTKYDKMSFTEDVILDSGFNYLITNLCCKPSSLVSLIFNPSDIAHVKIKKTKYNPWKSYNILCSSFQQCSKVFMSKNVYDDSKPLQFLRSNFLDYGLVLEIYQNIYSEKVAFFDAKEQAQNKQEDIEILFPQIYSELQNKNVYFPEELVTQKPARLYFPQKRVLIGSKIAQHITIHSTFK